MSEMKVRLGFHNSKSIAAKIVHLHRKVDNVEVVSSNELFLPNSIRRKIFGIKRKYSFFL